MKKIYSEPDMEIRIYRITDNVFTDSGTGGYDDPEIIIIESEGDDSIFA